MENDGRITVKELLTVLNTEVENGNGDCLIFVGEYYLNNKFKIDRDDIWGNTINFNGIHVQDIESTPEQDKESQKMIDDYYKNLSPEEKKAYDDLKNSTISQEEWKNRKPSSKIDKNDPLVKYIDYLAEMMNNMIKYEEYLAKNIDDLYVQTNLSPKNLSKTSNDIIKNMHKM